MNLEDMEIAEHKDGTTEVVKIFIHDSIWNSGTPGGLYRGATLLLKLLPPPLQQVKQLPPLPDNSFEESLLLPEDDSL